eukprot:gene7602-11925_t
MKSENYWKHDSTGIFGNEFIQRILSKKKYHFINHHLHIHFEKAEEKFHHLSKDYWIPFLILGLDNKKEYKTGINSWKIVDEKGFVFCLVFEDSKIYKNFKEENFPMMRAVDKIVPFGAYTYIIEACKSGGLDNASYLVEKKRKFIISCSATHPKELWKLFFHTFVLLKETKVVYGPEYATI